MTTVPWKKRKFGELFAIRHGYAFDGKFFSNSGPYVLLTPGNFYDEGGFKRKGEKEKYYSGKVPEAFILNSGDLLVAMTEQAEGLLGSTAVVPESGVYLHNQRLGLVTDLRGDEIDKLFLYYLFNTKQVRGQIRASASGVKVRHTSPSRIYEVEVEIPPLPVQRKIADILSAYDDLIENNTRRIKILEEMAQAIYREWFVHFRFPGHEQAAMVETELGMAPEGWESVALGQIAEINARSIRGSDLPGIIHYVDISSVSTGQINTITDMRFDQAPGRARRILRHGDTIWSCVRPNRKSYSLIISPTENMIASTGFAVISPLSVPYTYLHQSVTTDEFVAYLTNHARGAAYPAVTAEDFEHAIVQLPDPDLTHQYHAAVEPMFLLKHSLQKRNNMLRHTRDLLLPKLVSGEVDVSGLEVSS